jgi:hypothetical protein
MADQDVPSDSLDFIFDYTKGAPDIQLEDIASLDNKMVQIFSAASVIIGLGGISSSAGHPASAWFIAFAVLAYVGVGIAALVHLRGRELRRSRHADALWQRLWNHSVTDIKHSLVQDIADAYAHNKTVTKDKAGTLRWALLAAAAEVVLVGCAAVARLAS